MTDIWYKVREALKEKHSLSRFTPLWGNYYSKAGRADAGFHLWANNGLRKIQDLYNGELMMKFEELQAKLNTPNTHFFKCLQMRSFIAPSNN